MRSWYSWLPQKPVVVYVESTRLDRHESTVASQPMALLESPFWRAS
jgi:hypothetical protein